MNIAIASGKGGTGKTLIATNLAFTAGKRFPVALYDLDVEEPNDHLFFDSADTPEHGVDKMIPDVDPQKCTLCGTCTQVCEFHAIITLPDQVMVFPELCHSCYSCLEMCPEGAISSGTKTIGTISAEKQGPVSLVTGRLKITEFATAALISETKKEPSASNNITFYDAPPGSSCPFIETVKDSDYVILVGEPSPFGLHDMDIVARTLRNLHTPYSVIVNKDVEGNTIIDEYCRENNIDIIGRLPLSMNIAREYANGQLIVKNIKGMDTLFEQLLDTIIAKTSGEHK